MPHSNSSLQYRNLHLLSITCALRLRLRTRLTLRGQTFLRKPPAFDRGDSHPPLATHANILSSVNSTWTSLQTSTSYRSLPYHITIRRFGGGFSPVYLRRISTRPVSCYALSECMAASKPTSWLSRHLHLLSHLNPLSGTLAVGLGSFPLDDATYLPPSDCL